jgi:hypothetical protein
LAELIIDKKYYNNLDIEGFSRMMKDPSFCYKFYWLEAIVQLISENKKKATYEEIINEMISNAWYSVLEFHLHLSGLFGGGEIKDNLEKAVNRLKVLCELPNNASKVEIKNKLAEFSDDKELRGYKMELTKNVPYKALSGLMLRRGYREEFCDIVTKNLNTDFTAKRMIGYLSHYQHPPLEEIVDEMLAILNDRIESCRRRI